LLGACALNALLKIIWWTEQGDARKMYPDYSKREDIDLVISFIEKYLENRASAGVSDHDTTVLFTEWLEIFKRLKPEENNNRSVIFEKWTSIQHMLGFEELLEQLGFPLKNEIIYFSKQKKTDKYFRLEIHPYGCAYYPENTTKKMRHHRAGTQVINQCYRNPKTNPYQTRPGAITWNGIEKLLSKSKPIIVFESPHYWISEINEYPETQRALQNVSFKNISEITEQGRREFSEQGLRMCKLDPQPFDGGLPNGTLIDGDCLHDTLKRLFNLVKRNSFSLSPNPIIVDDTGTLQFIFINT
jgi:hypothetical protein